MKSFTAEAGARPVSWRRRVRGGSVAFIGFLLSPLSWWNDLLVNVPLAVAFGWLVSLAHRPLFEPAVIVGYWLTNLVGLVLLHKGAQAALSDQPGRPYSRRDLVRDLLISVLYTGVIVVLIQLKLLQMVRAGEISGALDVVLRRLAELTEKSQRIKNKVVAAKFYPKAALLVATGVLGVLIVLVVPRFQQIFERRRGRADECCLMTGAAKELADEALAVDGEMMAEQGAGRRWRIEHGRGRLSL